MKSLVTPGRNSDSCSCTNGLRGCGVTTSLKAFNCSSIITGIVQTAFCMSFGGFARQERQSFLNRSLPSVRLFASPLSPARSPKRRTHRCYQCQVCNACTRPFLTQTTGFPFVSPCCCFCLCQSKLLCLL
jgi:hypothetical protein